MELIETLMSAVQNGQSMCHQMLMGEGKTTVIGPLLSMLLADGTSSRRRDCYFAAPTSLCSRRFNTDVEGMPVL